MWEFDDGTTSTEFEPSHNYTEAGLYQIKLTVTGEGGVAYAFHTMEVYILPYLDFFVEPSLVMLPNEIVKSFNLSQYGSLYQWDFGDGTTYYAKDTSHLYTLPGVYDVSLHAWTEHGCTASMIIPEAVTVIAEGSIEFPNAFKPSPDGPTGGWYNPKENLNEVFYPVQEGVVEYELAIYSRWGERLFYTTDINQGWDGYYNGELCPQAVYIYKAVVTYGNGNRYELAGDITLLYKGE